MAIVLFTRQYLPAMEEYWKSKFARLEMHTEAEYGIAAHFNVQGARA